MSPRLPLCRMIVLLLAATLAVSALRAVEPVRVVATGGRIGYTFYRPALENTAFRQRTPHVLGGPVAEMQVGFMDWMYTDKTETANADNDVTITHAWIERASTGQVVPLTFSGARTLVLPTNSTTPCWLSDPVPSAAWSGTAPARDEVFWVHARGTIPEGGKVPVGTPANYTGGARFVAYPTANDPGGVDTAGPVPAITGGTTRNEGLPLVFLGRYAEPGHLAVIGVGDSILHGSGDYTGGSLITGSGFFNRAALDANGANAIAVFNLTRHGQSAGAFINPARQSRQTSFLRYANVVVEEYGTNDLSQNGSGDPTTILSRLDTIWTMARDAGVQKIVRTRLLPRTASTDDWSTLENQTPNPGWGDGDKRDTINAGLQAALADGRVDVLLDTLAVLADPADDNSWLTNGIPDHITADGTHIARAGNILLGTALRAALLSLAVDEDVVRYSTWSSAIDWNGADSSAAGDANADGVTNLEAYAYGLDPLTAANSAQRPSVSYDNTTPGGPWLSIEYRQSNNAPDVLFGIESSEDLSTWTELTADGENVVSEVADADPDGDGSTVLRRVRVLHDTTDKLFLRLSLEL